MAPTVLDSLKTHPKIHTALALFFGRGTQRWSLLSKHKRVSQRRWHESPQQAQWRASVITGNTSDSSPAVALSFGDGYYVFNAGENTQRALTTTTDTAYKRTTNVAFFLTQTRLIRLAGLGAMVMDREAVFDALHIIGPPGLVHYLAAMRSWRQSASTHAKVTETSSDLEPFPVPCFQDQNIAVYAIPLLPCADVPSAENSMGSPLSEAHECRKRMIDFIFPNETTPKLKELPRDDPFHQQLPRFHEKPLRVRPTMAYVVAGAENAVIILDIPSPSYIPSLRDSFTRSTFYSKLLSKGSNVRSIFHTCGQGVLEDGAYVDFMNAFPPTANHIISSPDYDRDQATFKASAIHQLRMNKLDDAMFPIPPPSPELTKRLADIPNLPVHSFPFEQGLAVDIQSDARPVLKADPPVADPSLPSSVLQTFAALQHKVIRQDARLQLREKQKRHPKAARERYRRFDDTAIIPLGTSGTHASLFRNNPSILVRIPERGSILLDAGEGTLGQLNRLYGQSGADEILHDLRCIFISENRAAHHGGLASLLAKRRQLDPPAPNPLYVVAEYDIHLSLREVSDIEDLGIEDPASNGVFPILIEVVNSSLGEVDTVRAEWASVKRSWEARKTLCQELGLLSFQAVRASAHPNSYGLDMRHKDGWRIVYSGRNVPTRAFPRAPANTSTVLIHGCTVEETRRTHGSVRRSVRAAIAVGESVKAKHILLTLFSGQTPGSNLVLKKRGKSKPLVSFAFDHARLTLGTMWRMNLYLPVIEQIFRQDGYLEEEDEDEAPQTESSA